jgi:hypothetical protein
VIRIADRQTDRRDGWIPFRPPAVSSVPPRCTRECRAVAVWFGFFLLADTKPLLALPLCRYAHAWWRSTSERCPCLPAGLHVHREVSGLWLGYPRPRSIPYSCRVRLRLNAIVTVACSRVATAAVWSVPCLKRVPHSPHCKHIAWSAQQYSRVSTVGAQWFGWFRDLPLRL